MKRGAPGIGQLLRLIPMEASIGPNWKIKKPRMSGAAKAMPHSASRRVGVRNNRLRTLALFSDCTGVVTMCADLLALQTGQSNALDEVTLQEEKQNDNGQNRQHRRGHHQPIGRDVL